MSYVIGVDIGTQGSKGVLLDESLNVTAMVYAEQNYIQPKPGWFEHDAEKTWWGGFKTILNLLLEKTSISPSEIAGVGCSTISPCMLPTDENGKPLRNAILYGIDTRSKEEVEEVLRQLGEETTHEAGKVPSLGTDNPVPKLLWLKKNEPEIFLKTRKIFQGTSYITYKLTGRFLLDFKQAGLWFYPIYNQEHKEWDTEMCKMLGFSPDLLPDLMNCYDIAGTVTPEASAETGLRQGTPVVLGAADGLAELISAGGFSQGDVTLIYGSTGIVSLSTGILTDQKIENGAFHLMLENRSSIGGATATTGSLTKWFRDNFGDVEKIIQDRTGVNAYSLLSRQAENIPPGSEGLIVLPYFSGERAPIFDSSARGVIFGLTMHHTRAHLYRALLEGTAYSFCHILENFEKYKVKISQVIACGGGAQSSLWVKIVSDVIGHDQTILSIPTGSDIGSAYLAAKGIGLIDDIASFLLDRRQENARIVKADMQNHSRYQELYHIYRNLYEHTKGEMWTLSKLMEASTEQ